MERVFRKPEEEAYPQKIFAHQLITVDDLQQFKKQLVTKLITFAFPTKQKAREQ